jgi:hypothetical protein
MTIDNFNFVGDIAGFKPNSTTIPPSEDII